MLILYVKNMLILYVNCNIIKLFCFKQYLLGSNKNNSTAIKPHMVHHFIYEMTQTGSTNNANTRTTEQKHVIVRCMESK